MSRLRNSYQLFRYNKILPNFVTKRYNNSNSVKKYDEIKIPVPWGEIYGKWWGSKDKQPILVVHGWQDTSGSYDTLIPLLSDQVSYLAIDYPGHGLSSPIPRGMYYHFGDAPIILRRIHKYFDWPKISLMGHSLGGEACLMYTSLFPHETNMLIELDCIKPYTYEIGGNIDRAGKNIDLFLKYDEQFHSNAEPKSYPLEEIKNKLFGGLKKSIDLDKIHYILNSMMKPSKTDPNKYYFTRDTRLKTGNIVTWTIEDIVEHVKRIQCPMLHITFDSKFMKSDEYMQRVLNLLKATNKLFEHVTEKGMHHHHLNRPETIAGVINDFISRNYKDTRLNK